MRSEPIADLHDPRIDDYRNLKDATLASSRHRFIVEGRGNLLVLLSSSSHRPASILLSRRTFDGLAADLERLAPDCPIYVAEQALLDAIVGYPIHRGCLAACDRGAARDALGLVDEPGGYVRSGSTHRRGALAAQGKRRGAKRRLLHELLGAGELMLDEFVELKQAFVGAIPTDEDHRIGHFLTHPAVEVAHRRVGKVVAPEHPRLRSRDGRLANCCGLL